MKVRKPFSGLYMISEQEKHLPPFLPHWDLLSFLRDRNRLQSVLSVTWVEAAKGGISQKGKENPVTILFRSKAAMGSVVYSDVMLTQDCHGKNFVSPKIQMLKPEVPL